METLSSGQRTPSTVTRTVGSKVQNDHVSPGLAASDASPATARTVWSAASYVRRLPIANRARSPRLPRSWSVRPPSAASTVRLVIPSSSNPYSSALSRSVRSWSGRSTMHSSPSQARVLGLTESRSPTTTVGLRPIRARWLAPPSAARRGWAEVAMAASLGCHRSGAFAISKAPPIAVMRSFYRMQIAGDCGE